MPSVFNCLGETFDTGHWIVIIFPQSPAYLAAPYYGRYGPSTDSIAAAVIADMEELDRSNSYLHFYDAHKYGAHDYSDSDAGNWDHLSSNGALKLSTRVDSIIGQFITP